MEKEEKNVYSLPIEVNGYHCLRKCSIKINKLVWQIEKQTEIVNYEKRKLS